MKFFACIGKIISLFSGFPGRSQRRPNEIKLGAIAQLGERLNGIQEVVGSIPSGSTKVTRA